MPTGNRNKPGSGYTIPCATAKDAVPVNKSRLRCADDDVIVRTQDSAKIRQSPAEKIRY